MVKGLLDLASSYFPSKVCGMHVISVWTLGTVYIFFSNPQSSFSLAIWLLLNHCIISNIYSFQYCFVLSEIYYLYKVKAGFKLEILSLLRVGISSVPCQVTINIFRLLRPPYLTPFWGVWLGFSIWTAVFYLRMSFICSKFFRTTILHLPCLVMLNH